MAATMRSSVSSEKPSSSTYEQVRYSGRAPMHERSFTVPQTESLPTLPPGNSAGDTMNPSVLIAILPAGTSITAASSAVKWGLSR